MIHNRAELSGGCQCPVGMTLIDLYSGHDSQLVSCPSKSVAQIANEHPSGSVLN